MKIWVHLNGQQQGPYEFDELKQLPITPQTPVWYEGLAQWTVASVAPATAVLFQQQPQATQQQPQPTRPQAQAQPQPQQPQGQQPQGQQSAKRPASYIVWSILLMVFCCSPFAVVSLILGVLSSSRYDAGDYVGSVKMSNAAAWLLMITIAFALLTLPFGLSLLHGCA